MIEEILCGLGLGEIFAESQFGVRIIGGKIVYVENACGITSFTDSCIIISTKKKSIKITGEELMVKKYTLGDAVICGKIKSVTME